MMIFSKYRPAGALFIASILVSACGGSSTTATTDPQDDAPETPTVPVTPSVPDTPTVPETPDTPVVPDTPTVPETPDAPTVPDTPTVPETPDTPVVPDTPTVPETPDEPTGPATNPTPSGDSSSNPLIPTTVALEDLSGGDDDSPTAVESASLAGPFVKDISRSAGPPSAPNGLTLLLASDNWVKFSWAPSVDDQSVEAYEIYRDNQLIATVRGNSGDEHDYRNWLSTSFTDCNYTRFTYCGGIQPTPGSSYSYSVAAIDNEGMRSERSEPVIFTTEQLSASPVDLSAYSSVFSEEFNGSGLDRNSWKTSLPWGPDRIINRENQYFVNTFGNNPPAYDPFVFTGETLRITGIETPPEMREAANNQPYLSGVISTSDYFEMTYGYVEMSARVASGDGLLSTFFLFNQNFDRNSPEIDVLEYIGTYPNTAYQTYHYYDSNRARYASGEKNSTPTMQFDGSENLSNGFHTYAVLWEPGFVVWYIDGQEVRRLSGARISDEPMNIIVQLVMGSEWIGSPAASSVPAVFEIDYIRAWQKP